MLVANGFSFLLDLYMLYELLNFNARQRHIKNDYTYTRHKALKLKTHFGIEMASTASCRNTASSRNFCSHYVHKHCHQLALKYTNNSTKLD